MLRDSTSVTAAPSPPTDPTLTEPSDPLELTVGSDSTSVPGGPSVTAGLGNISLGGITMDDMPLSSANVRAQLAVFEADQAEADELAHQRRLHEQVILRRGDAERAKDVETFEAQETFRWAVPVEFVEHHNFGDVPQEYSCDYDYAAEVRRSAARNNGIVRGVQPSIIGGQKHRPPVIAAPVEVPDEPPEGMLDETQADEEWGERFSRLQLVGRQYATVRRALEFDTEESLFHAGELSSDDSEGYDPDVASDWRDETNELFQVCRAFEATDFAGEAEASRLAVYLRAHASFEWNNTEQHLIWDAVRHTFHRAEPLHSKRWLSHMHALLRSGQFDAAPSVALFSQIIFAAMDVEHLPDRMKRKIRRWANRSSYLVRRRAAILREMGVSQPTWADVKASCTGCNRDVPVPTYTLRDALLLVCGDVDGDIRIIPEEDLAPEEVAARVHAAADAERAEAIKAIMASANEEDRITDDDEDDDDDTGDVDLAAVLSM